MTDCESPRLLLIDVGNSRTKWAVVAGERWEASGAAERADQAIGQVLGPAPVQVGVAVTGSEAAQGALVRALADRWPRVEVRQAASGSRFGDLRNAYGKPDNMGVDRWLGMIAAWRPGEGGCCVIDAGTAITVDLVDAAGRHAGGWIAPGIALMQGALAAGTRSVGRHVGQRTERDWGADTPDAVAAGCDAAFRGLLTSAVETARLADPEVRFLVSGGSAEPACRVLSRLGAAPEHRPQLVLEGLARWLRGGAG